MSVLTIRSHKRYALRQSVRLSAPGLRAARGLLIELSAEGCRVSGLPDVRLAAGAPVTLRIDADLALEAQVRWTREGIVGLRLVRPLHRARLEELLALCRGPETRRYGT